MQTEIPSAAILSLWFGEAADDPNVAQRQASLWWSKNPDVDKRLRDRFETVLHQAATGGLADWPQTPRARLARIILFDQLPRNMYRGEPQAFAWDPLARQEAEAALAAGDEADLRPIERVFLYMPFEHAEAIEYQDLAVERFAALLAAAPPAHARIFQGYVDFAVRHRDIIRRFGRFPHRNAILGRPSSAAELEFLQTPESSF